VSRVGAAERSAGSRVRCGTAATSDLASQMNPPRATRNGSESPGADRSSRLTVWPAPAVDTALRHAIVALTHAELARAVERDTPRGDAVASRAGAPDAGDRLIPAVHEGARLAFRREVAAYTHRLRDGRVPPMRVLAIIAAAVREIGSPLLGRVEVERIVQDGWRVSAEAYFDR
jgi:hypothetical protein